LHGAPFLFVGKPRGFLLARAQADRRFHLRPDRKKRLFPSLGPGCQPMEPFFDGFDNPHSLVVSQLFSLMFHAAENLQGIFDVRFGRDPILDRIAPGKIPVCKTEISGLRYHPLFFVTGDSTLIYFHCLRSGLI
jgi:hypothetical protein